MSVADERSPCAIIRFGRFVPQSAFEQALDDGKVDLLLLEGAFKGAGIKHFTAAEAVTVRDGARLLVENLGYKNGIIFPSSMWLPRFVAVFAAADWLRDYITAAISVRYAFRPREVQQAVNPGSPDSDHVHCLAVDLQFKTIAFRNLALDRVAKLQADEAWLRVSYGWKRDSNILHLGLLTDNGARTWEYK